MIIISLLLLFFLVPNIVITIQNDFKIKFTFNIIKLINIILKDKMIIMGILMLEFLFILVLFYFKYNFKIRNTNSNNGVPKRIDSNEFGSSRFSTMQEIKNQFTTWKFNKNNNSGGMIVAIDNNKYYVEKAKEFLKIENPSRALITTLIDRIEIDEEKNIDIHYKFKLF